MMLRGVVLTLLLGIWAPLASSASGQIAPGTDSADPPTTSPASAEPAGPAPGEELSIYVMTMGPGPEVWERFGHNAIRVRDERLGTDIAYNWGMFSFEQEGFLLRFIQGRMLYWMEGFDAQLMANAYAGADRSVWIQELELSPTQRADLRDFLEWNAREENRYYLYDYYLDNCSTRVRDAIDLALGGQLREKTGLIPARMTFRAHTRSLTGGDPLLYTGLMLGLAQPVDRPISVWEEMFLPMELMSRIREMTVVNEAGETVPLVKSEFAAWERTAPLTLADPSSRWLTFTLVGVLAGGVVLLTGVQRARHRSGGALFPWLTTAWAVVTGMLGMVLLGLWVATDHTAAHYNENLFQVNPLLLGLAVLVPLAARGSAVMAGRAARLAVVIAGLSVIGLLARVLPGFTQSNGEIIGLVMPVHLAVAYSLVVLARSRRRPGSADGNAYFRGTDLGQTVVAE
jgi:hypothetical protein